MYLGAYEFEGDPDELLAAYERMMTMVPPGASDLHVCLRGEVGITVLDSCPSEAVFDAFSSGPDFTAVRTAAALPVPTITKIGEVQRARLPPEVSRDLRRGRARAW